MGWLKDFFSDEEAVKEKAEETKLKIKKSLFNNEELSELEPYEDNEEKWISMDITIMAPYSELIKLKTALKPYAEELDWEMDSGTNTFIEDNTKMGGGKIKRVNITIHPKNRVISPIDFLNNKEKIMGLVFAIHRDILHGGNHEEAIKDFRQTLNITYTVMGGHKPNKNDYIMSETVSFLNYNYKLVDRIRFEKRNNKLALKLFGNTAEQDLRNIFKPEEQKESKPKKEQKTKHVGSEKGMELLKSSKDLEDNGKKFKQELMDIFGFKL